MDNFSKDADQTRFIKYAFIAAMVLIGVLTAIEILAMLLKTDTMLIFTGELTHQLVTILVAGFVGSGAYLWGKKNGNEENEELKQHVEELNNYINQLEADNGNDN